MSPIRTGHLNPRAAGLTNVLKGDLWPFTGSRAFKSSYKPDEGDAPQPS